MVGGGWPLLPQNFGCQTDPPSFKNGDFQLMIARSGSTLGPSEYSKLTPLEVDTSFPTILRRTAHVPPNFFKEGSKTQIDHFFL